MVTEWASLWPTATRSMSEPCECHKHVRCVCVIPLAARTERKKFHTAGVKDVSRTPS